MRLAELLGTLSIAADTGMGMPPDHGIRCASLAARLGELGGLTPQQRQEAFYLSLMRFVGCTADSDIASDVMGDEVRVRGALHGVDWVSPFEFLPGVARALGAGKNLRGAVALVRALAKMPRLMNGARSHCEVGDRLAGEIGFDASFRAALLQSFERWDGRGWPAKTAGNTIALSMRVTQVAEALEIGEHTRPEDPTWLLRKRSGTALDPDLVRQALEQKAELCRVLQVNSPWQTLLDSEPAEPWFATEEQVDRVLSAMADFADLKSNYTRGHSRAVAELAAATALRLGLAHQTALLARRAGLLHDIGRVVVSAGIWDKPARLTDAERESVRLHTYAGERILARSRALATISEVAVSAHERVDGSGYHRRVAGDACVAAARVLAAADVYCALTEQRPQRAAFTPRVAAQMLEEMATRRALCPDAVAAVLQVTGQAPPTPNRQGSTATNSESAATHSKAADVLTQREVEVLALVTRGMTNKEIASALQISVKTAGRHLENVFAKLGVTTRSAAAVWAMQNGVAGKH